jgi:energy-converting hydrogenase Eha subunit F
MEKKIINFLTHTVQMKHLFSLSLAELLLFFLTHTVQMKQASG